MILQLSCAAESILKGPCCVRQQVLVDELGRPLPRPAALEPSSPRQDLESSAVQRLHRASLELTSKRA